MERGSEGRKMGETKLREIALPRRSRPPRKKIFRISYFVEIGMRDGRFLSPPPRPCPRPFSCGRQENGQPSTFLSAAIPPPPPPRRSSSLSPDYGIGPDIPLGNDRLPGSW